MKKTILNSYQFAVAHVEYSTGIVLKLDRTYYLGEGDVFIVFDSEKEANDYMLKTVNSETNIECWLEDNLGNHIKTIGKEGERK